MLIGSRGAGSTQDVCVTDGRPQACTLMHCSSVLRSVLPIWGDWGWADSLNSRLLEMPMRWLIGANRLHSSCVTNARW